MSCRKKHLRSWRSTGNGREDRSVDTKRKGKDVGEEERKEDEEVGRQTNRMHLGRGPEKK